MDFPMRTGTGLIGDEHVDPELELRVTSLVMAFAEHSIRTAYKYVEHSNRTVIMPLDLQLSMKYEVFHFMNRPNIQDCINKHREGILEDMLKEYNGEELDDDINTISDVNEIGVECNCDLCNKIKMIENNWIGWQPQTNLEKILKRNIDKMNQN